MPSFACVPGIRVEALGDIWAAFSPASGETLLLNDTSAAVLEVLSQHAMAYEAVIEVLSADAAAPQAEIDAALRDHWQKLIEAGLVRQVETATGPSQ